MQRALARDANGDPAVLYDEAYYRSHCGPRPYERSERWTTFFADVADAIVRAAQPASVIDVGCAFGFLVEALWDRNVRAEGFDVSPYAIENVRADVRAFCRVGSILDPPAGRYDLAACLEVLEHVPAAETGPAIRNLTALADAIAFSSTPSDFDEPTHVNVRPVLVWLEKFAEAGFAPDPRADVSRIAPHAMLLRKVPERPSAEELFAFSEIVRARIETARERERAGEIERHRRAAVDDRDALRVERDRLAAERDRIAAERDRITTERDRITTERDRITTERNGVAAQCGELRAALQSERSVAAGLRDDLAAARDQAERVAATAAALLDGEIAQTRAQVHQTEQLTQVVVGSRFWRAKLALGRLLRRNRRPPS